MSNQRKTSATHVGLVFCCLLLLAACQQTTHTVTRGFYFWKTNVTLAPKEHEALQNLKCKLLYVKCFDVVWNATTGKPQPVALARFTEQLLPAVQLVPVVFITNETLQQLTDAGADSLANNINRLLVSLWQENALPAVEEIQLDCDWTATTRPRYFQLLQTLQSQSFFRQKTISATIRLHQIKYMAQTGVPPVSKGLLMCYNMGNLVQPDTKNSIVDVDVMAQYTAALNRYPLHLDIGLPIFDWWVWFRGQAYQGLLHTDALPAPYGYAKTTTFNADTTINGFTFMAGDWLRHETATPKQLEAGGQALYQAQFFAKDVGTGNHAKPNHQRRCKS